LRFDELSQRTSVLQHERDTQNPIPPPRIIDSFLERLKIMHESLFDVQAVLSIKLHSKEWLARDLSAQKLVKRLFKAVGGEFQGFQRGNEQVSRSR
jgi:hypothetical protein